MRRMWGGLMASSAVTAVACARFDGGTGAAGLLEDETGTGEGTGVGTGTGTGEGTGTGTATGTGEAPTIADWMKSFSADKAGDDPSNQEWLANAGVKDLDGLAKIARDNQKALRESGRVKIPGENATDEERAAFREAIGAPKEAAGYEVTMPEGAENFEIDTGILDPLREIAHKHAIPAPAFKELADKFLAAAVDDAKAEVARTDTEAADKIKEWGPKADQHKEEFRRAAQFLGLSKSDVADIQREFGAGKTLDLFAKIGGLMGEDFFAQGNPSQRFGVASLEQAQTALDNLVNDKAFGKLINDGDKAARAKYDNAVAAVAAFRQAASKKPAR